MRGDDSVSKPYLNHQKGRDFDVGNEYPKQYYNGYGRSPNSNRFNPEKENYPNNFYDSYTPKYQD